jgi:hypothetical protein
MSVMRLSFFGASDIGEHKTCCAENHLRPCPIGPIDHESNDETEPPDEMEGRLKILPCTESLCRRPSLGHKRHMVKHCLHLFLPSAWGRRVERSPPPMRPPSYTTVPSPC